MQATKYIGGLAYEINLQETNELFKDPYRNGVLLNHVVCKEFGLNQHGFIRSPKSIDDCRGNVNKALTAIKSRVATFSNSYLYYS